MGSRGDANRTRILSASLARGGRRWAAPVAAAAALAASAGALALAQKPIRPAAAASVTHACLSKRTGALRLMTGRGGCARGEVSVALKLVGRRGGKGATGPKGQTGLEGPVGARGVTGATGPAGRVIAGPAGAAGEAGATGPSGPSGPQGSTGSLGTTGENGAAGPTGPKGVGGGGSGGGGGATGATGIAGTTGAEGSSLPTQLPSGESETGVWALYSTEEEPELPPSEVMAQISFPIPLTTASLTEAHVVRVTEAKTAELETVPGSSVVGCVSSSETPKVGLIEHPVAESGYLCVYAGVEEINNYMFTAIEKPAREPGASRNGATVVFQVETGNKPAEINARGTWAVKQK